MNDRSMAPNLDETALVTERQGRTLRAEEMTVLLRQAREAAPAIHLRPERDRAETEPAIAEDVPFETTMMMDRASLSRSDRTLRPEEFPAVPVPGEENAPARPSSPVINLRVEKTPAEFSHLYASLERQIAGVGDVTLISGETLGRSGRMCWESPARCWGRGRRRSRCTWR